MPTFIDESGCTGTRANSRPYFRLAAVWVARNEVGPFTDSIRQLRRLLKVKESFEFKHSLIGNYPERTERFFRCALRHGFRFAVCSIEKTKGTEWEHASSDWFHCVSSTSLAATLRPHYCLIEATMSRKQEPVTVDCNHDQNYLNYIAASFQAMSSAIQPGRSLVGRPKWGDSSKDDLLQLADMTCGTIGEYLDRGSNPHYDLIRAAGLGLDIGPGKGITCFG